MKREMKCTQVNCENTGCAHHDKHTENAHCGGFCKRNPGAECHPVNEEPKQPGHAEEVL